MGCEKHSEGYNNEQGVKKTLYQQVIVPTVTYGAKNWDLRETERRLMNVLEMKCLKYMMGVTRWDRVMND